MGKCTFNAHWLSKDDSSGCKVSQWARKEDENSIFCNPCDSVININKGFQAIVQHASSKKHKQQCAIKLNVQQLHLKNQVEADHTSGSIVLYSSKDSATIAELIWAMKTAICNYSFASSCGVTDTFKAMFSNLPEGFCLNPKKIHYLITDALGPYFEDEIINDLKNSFYTIMYDETTNASDKKELQIIVRYWSEKHKGVVSQHLKSFFIGSATAEVIVKKITETLDCMNIHQKNLLMLGSDGPNVNKKVHRLIDENLKSDFDRRLVNIGTCNIHTVHNAFLKGLNNLGENAVDLVSSIYYFFHGWPSRWEEYNCIQNKEGLPNKRFLKHCSTRWLTVEAACKRIVEQWPAITEYFLKYLPTKKSEICSKRHYKTVAALLKNKSIKAEVYFVISAAGIFSSFLRVFQKDEPLVHLLHSELSALVRTLMGRFCTQAFLKSENINIEDIELEVNHVPDKKTICCNSSKKEIEKLDDCEKHLFLKAAKQHYLAACIHIIEKTSLSSPVLKSLGCLHPSKRKSTRSCNDIIMVAKELQLSVPLDRLADEWKSVQVEKNPKINRIDHFWCDLLSKKNSLGEIKYPLLSTVIKAALVLSHGNAEVERGFSLSGHALTEDRAAMSERTLNAIMIVKSHLKWFNNKPELVPITKQLMTLARNAYRNYEEYLLKQKEMKKQQEEDLKKQEEKIRLEKESKEKILKEKEDIKKQEEILEKNREKEERKRKTADNLFQEATKRLKIGLENKSMEDIELAEVMLQSVASVRKEETEERKSCNTIQKTLEKKKSSLIEHYFKKTTKEK